MPSIKPTHCIDRNDATADDEESTRQEFRGTVDKTVRELEKCVDTDESKRHLHQRRTRPIGDPSRGPVSYWRDALATQLSVGISCNASRGLDTLPEVGESGWREKLPARISGPTSTSNTLGRRRYPASSGQFVRTIWRSLGCPDAVAAAAPASKHSATTSYRASALRAARTSRHPSMAWPNAGSAPPR